jgi:membrane protease YdiL (CAAX protease family)
VNVDNWSELAATAAAYFGLAVVGALVFTVLWQRGTFFRAPWLPMQRIRAVPWQGIDVFMGFMVLIVIPILVDESLRKAGFFEWLYGTPRSFDMVNANATDKALRSREELWSMVLATPLQLGLIILSLQQLRQVRLAELGITPVRAGNNAALGFVLWLIITPVALAIYYVALQATPKEWVEEHPIARVTEQPLAVSEWVLLLIATIVLAPLLEELVFRGVMLPWQVQGGWVAEGIIVLCAFVVAILGGAREDGKTFNPDPALFVLAMLPVVFLLWVIQAAYNRPVLIPSPNCPESVPALPASTESRVFAGPPEDKAQAWPVLTTAATRIEAKLAALSRSAAERRPIAGSAVFVNGLFFGMVHSQIWPSPIPLLLLGAGLAWVRYRTSSLVGAFALHALFNAVASLALVFEHVWG